MAAIYPFFAGLYIFGFFWIFPFDLVSAFPFTDFLYKSAIVFLAISAFLVVYLSFIIASSALVNESDGESTEFEGEKEVSHDQWRDLTRKRKGILIAFAGLRIALVVVVFFRAEVEDFSKALPEILPLVLLLLFLFSDIFRFVLPRTNWLVVKLLYAATLTITIPIAIGFQDSLIYDDEARNVMVLVADETCQAVFLGADSAIVKCGGDYILVDRAEKSFSFRPRP